MSAASGNRVAPNQFLNGPNYQKLVGFLRQHYVQKLGMHALPERMEGRLTKTVQHYMTEINRVQGGAQKPVQVLNQEVVHQTTASLDAWLKKQEAPAAPSATTLGAFTKPDEYGRLFEDTNTRYETLMADRMPPAMPVPPLPNFKTAATPAETNMFEMDEDPVVLMQRLQKQRDEQARAMGLSVPAPAPAPAPAAPPRLEITEMPPSAAHPVPPQAEAAPPLLAPRPQDYIIPQEDLIKYRETELNLFITSADRDWLRNTAENRYNFTVNFNTAMSRNGFSYNAAIQKRLRNIQRIEFVKVIVPIEPLTTLVRMPSSGVFDTTRVVNVFSLPFVGVRIAELETNGFSTNPDEDNTFAIVQYDTTWSSDLSAPALPGTDPAPVLTKSGYTTMIPKFLKSQKVYSPTPLATLQKLSLRMERHTGEIISSDSDVWSIQRVVLSDAFTSIGTDATVYNSAGIQNSYVFLQTSKYFPFGAIGEGDLLYIQGALFSTVSTAANDFTTWLNRKEGHYVVATAHVGAGGAVTDGRNAVGYCNVIVLRSRFDDPSTGSVARTTAYFGGSAGAESAFATALDTPATEPAQTGAALLNASRQTHYVLRVITRDLDSSSNIRPDNV
jgi:hypothetical protein